MKTLIYYHNSCLDGSTAAAIVGLALTGLDVDYCPINYNNGVALANDAPIDALNYAPYQSVIFVDFAPNEEQLANITYHLTDNVVKNKTLIVLDHHNTLDVAKYETLCEERGVSPSKDIISQANVSGSMLAYIRYLPQLSSLSAYKSKLYLKIESLSPVAQYVSDYDTWKKSNPRAFTFYAGITSQWKLNPDIEGQIYSEVPPSVQLMMDTIGLRSLSDLMDKGLVQQAHDEAYINEVIDNTGKLHEPNDLIGVPHVTLTIERRFRDLACELAMKRFNTTVAINSNSKDGENVFWSVRSIPESTVTANAICTVLGGGGHVHAAGCQLTMEEFSKHY